MHLRTNAIGQRKKTWEIVNNLQYSRLITHHLLPTIVTKLFQTPTLRRHALKLNWDNIYSHIGNEHEANKIKKNFEQMEFVMLKREMEQSNSLFYCIRRGYKKTNLKLKFSPYI